MDGAVEWNAAMNSEELLQGCLSVAGKGGLHYAVPARAVLVDAAIGEAGLLEQRAYGGALLGVQFECNEGIGIENLRGLLEDRANHVETIGAGIESGGRFVEIHFGLQLAAFVVTDVWRITDEPVETRGGIGLQERQEGIALNERDAIGNIVFGSVAGCDLKGVGRNFGGGELYRRALAGKRY